MLTQLTTHRVFKPWGRTDIPAAFGNDSPAEPLGEIWFQREDGDHDALLVKYLFTSERLSVQVHPDDAAAQRAGRLRGKDEAWLVLDAEPGAEIAIGLKEHSSTNLRAAAVSGSIVEELNWRPVARGDAYYSPAGTLHSIGAGLTLLEIQQNCDVTYRFYDFGRPRELHLDEALRAAKPDLDISKSVERSLGGGRSVLVSGAKFTIERWRSTGNASLEASEEAPLWLVPLKGVISANGRNLELPSVWIAEGAVDLLVGEGGEILIAYEGGDLRDLA